MITEYLGKNSGYVHTIFYITCVLFTVLWVPTLSVVEFLAWFVGTHILVGYLISAFQHRYCSHRSWEPSRFVEVLSVFLCAAFVLIPSMGWVSVHKNHHRYTDTKKDPHGNAHSVWDNFMAFNVAPNKHGWPRWMFRDLLYLYQLKYYWEIAILFGALMFVIGLGGFWVGSIAAAYIFQVTLNIIGHPNRSPANRPWLALLLLYCGELYHKNHHDKPSLPRFGLIDTPYLLFIKFLDTKK